jgi:beta-galactosidase
MGTLSLDRDWFFGGKWIAAGSPTGRNQAGGQRITLPHTVVPLSWENWDPATWEAQWIYERQIAIPREFHGLRFFLHFDRVLAAATPTVNGHTLEQHLGGFLPFEREITALVEAGDNALAVVVDAGWLNVPPTGNPKGTPSVDYLLPGGITGSVTLRALPEIYIRDVFAKPTDVLESGRRLDLLCRIDAGGSLPALVRLEARLLDRGTLVARESSRVTLEKTDQEVTLTLSNLKAVHLWSPEKPSLYALDVTLYRNERPVHRFVRRVGFRDARFTVDGFFLNGDRLRIFGLDRHELFPYLGFAVPERLQRRDAAILRHHFNCNTVRCSHYPQSETFLDACDELGLMVWEEVPGWQYIGDQPWQDLVVRDAEAMIRRDRSHPSIIIWGVRVNESPNEPKLYERTTELARLLDGTRPASGSMTPDSRKTWQTDWHEDVFAFDDYHSAPDGSVGIDPPLAGVPYVLAETVGQRTYGGAGFHNQYRRAGDIELQQKQAIYHAQAHDQAANFERLAGVIAWCAFDYASQMNGYHNVKCPGITDVFRLPKLGAAFYLSQVDPGVQPVIEPNFYWDSAPGTLSTA